MRHLEWGREEGEGKIGRRKKDLRVERERNVFITPGR